MRKQDNDWSIEKPDDACHNLHAVEINGTIYNVPAKTSAICHSILLLVDAINDKDFYKH